ncbi:nuclear transport factor 2 family protein [Terriglobus sp. RCC_193]|uniref:nuclear transport factor 2 family protein n=1 Tax=Terriglobus sp. RCC_193 TaxID=3239218 RepID=UPI0035251DD3
MTETDAVLRQAYAAFNRRDVDSALDLMTEDVRWPKASEGGSVVGKDEIRAYWTRQWQEFDPCVEPLAITEQEDGSFRVCVHQVVKSLQGDLLSESQVVHIFAMRDGQIASMELGERDGVSSGPSTAFVHSS